MKGREAHTSGAVPYDKDIFIFHINHPKGRALGNGRFFFYKPPYSHIIIDISSMPCYNIFTAYPMKTTDKRRMIIMEKNVMNPVVAAFCGLLESHNVPYQLNEGDENMIRFLTKLPHHDATPNVFIHFNPVSQALTLALSRIAHFTSVGMDIYMLMNEFNSDHDNFGCKLFVDGEGYMVVLTGAIIAGEKPVDQIEDYLNISIAGLDKYYGRIIEIINKNKEETERVK